MKLNKIYQKKLYSRVFAKQFLSKFQDLSIKDLQERGVLRNPIVNEFHNDLLPYIYNNTNELNKNEILIIENLNDFYNNLFYQKKKEMHKQSLLNEIKRKENLEIKRLEEIEKRKEEKIRRKEELLRIKKENEKVALKKSIQNELVNLMELNDEPQEIFEINGYNIKSRKACKIIILFDYSKNYF
jgi:hypothetical protein